MSVTARMTQSNQPIFRFAPSPNGELHLGHAFSALLTQKLARQEGAKLLLRLEDIDTVRCTPENIQQMLDDLTWLGFDWDEDPIYQSTNFDAYQHALDQLRLMDLVYPCICSRNDIKQNATREKDPDGAPLYPGTCRDMDDETRLRLFDEGKPFAWRLDMQKAIEKTGPLTWQEFDEDLREVEIIKADPLQWGDVILARKYTPTSYHLSVVVDDAAQGVTHITRGKDLYFATAVHRVLQQLLKLPEPQYLHHGLILDDEGKKLSKSKKSLSLAALKKRGWTADQIRDQLDLD